VYIYLYIYIYVHKYVNVYIHIKGVPDAINEAQVIAVSLAVIVAVCAIGFGLTLGADLDHRDKELTIGTD
jgi:hypothetical protein